MVSKLQVDVDVDVKGADKLGSLGGNLQRTGLNLSKFVTGPLLLAGGAVTALAADAQKTDAKLSNVFDSMGAASFTSLDALNANAEALGQLSSFDDEGIKEAQATLLTFGNVTGDAFDRGIQSAVDMSELLGTDLQSSTVMLGKALNDPIAGITALSRAGVSFTAEQKETIAGLVEMGDVAGAQNLILAEMERQFGGTAAAIAQTDAGKAAQSFEDLGNAGESIGVLLLPVLSQLAGWLSQLATWFTSLDPGIKGFIVTIGAVAAAVGPVLLIGGKLISSFGAIGSAFRVLSALLLANPFVALAAAAVALVTLIVLNWDKIVAAFQNLWKDIQKIVGGIADFLGKAWEAVAGAATAAWDGVVNIIKGAINGVIDVINGLFGFLNGIQIGIPEINVGPVHVGGGVIDPFNIPLIPHLAAGGIVTAPTLALIGERAPEAVIPLSQLGELGGGDTFVFNVEGEVRDEEALVDIFQRARRLEKAMAP